MSDRDAISALLRATEINQYTLLASIAFLYYDYILTFPAELRLYWRGRSLSLASFFFSLNRYGSLLGHIPVIYEFLAPVTERTCRQFQLYHQLFCGVSTAIVSVLLIMRTYALYESSRTILISLVGLCTIAGSVSVWAVLATQHSPEHTSPATALLHICDVSLSNTQGRYLAIAWASIWVFDTTVFILTLYKRLRVGRTLENGLFALMLRDGTIYYGVLVLLYIADVATFLLASPATKGITITFTNVISSTTMNRLMLNIRGVEDKQFPSTYSGMSSIVFVRRDSPPDLELQLKE